MVKNRTKGKTFIIEPCKTYNLRNSYQIVSLRHCGINDNFVQCFHCQYFWIASQARNDAIVYRHCEERSNPEKSNMLNRAA